MPSTKPPYPAEFREQIVELVHVGRSPAELAREFGCSAQTIANWVGQAAIDRGKPLPGKDGLTSAEREELTKLKRKPVAEFTMQERWGETAVSVTRGRAGLLGEDPCSRRTSA